MKRANITTYDVLVTNFNKNLHNDAIEKKVSKQFTQYGETRGIFVRENNQGKFGVVKYLSEPDADRAVNESNGILLDGLPILVKRMERKNKPAGGGGAGSGNTGGNGGGSGGIMVAGAWSSTKDSALKNQLGKNPDIVPAVEPVAAASPGPEGELMLVTHIETPTLFWCQDLTESLQIEGEKLRKKLCEMCPTAPKLHGRPDPSKIYGAMFSADGEWYRCQMKGVNSLNTEKVRIQYIDFGNWEETNVKDLVELPADLTSIKPFAVKIMLHNTRFLGPKEREARRHLENTILQENVIVSPTFRLPDGTGQFAQVHHEKTGNVSQYLIDNGMAIVKPPKQQQGQSQLSEASSPSQLHLSEGGSYNSFSTRGFGGSDIGGFHEGQGPFPQGFSQANRQPASDQDFMRMGQRFGMPGANRGGVPKPAGGEIESPGQMSGILNSAISDLKVDNQNKQRALEKISGDLATERLKIKNIQQEYTALLKRKEENNLASQLKMAVDLASKVCQLRNQFSCDHPTAVDEAIELASSEDKLTENSVTSLSPLMTSLSQYRSLQQEISKITKSQEVNEEKLEERNALRKTLHQQLLDCVSEMEGMAFSERAQKITHCVEKLRKHYDNFFNLSVEPLSDFRTTVAKYQEMKVTKQKEFEQIQQCTDQQQEVVQRHMTAIGKSLSLSLDEERKDCDLNPQNQLKQYCMCLQKEISAKNVEASQEGNFIASLVQSVHCDLKAEMICASNLMRWETESKSMLSSMQPWLDCTPNTDKLMESRQLLKTLKSKLRHKLADKHDAEENEDKEMLEEVQKEVEDIQTEIHSTLLVEEKELTELASLVNSHFPEFLVCHPDCGLDIQLKYKGIVKGSHEISHYNLTPVPGSNGRLFFSKFSDQDIIVMECLLSDGHHLSKEEFLTQLMQYIDISHQTLLHPTSVFFDKKNRHAYMCFERGQGDILANCVQYGTLSHEDTHGVVKCVAEGLQAMHSVKVLHGEINPYSVLHHSDGSATLLPPDLSCRPIDRAKNKFTWQNGLEFMAPEMAAIPASHEPTGVVDMYSLGILILFLSCPEHPVPLVADGSLDISTLPTVSARALVNSLIQPFTLRPPVDVVLSSPYILNKDHKECLPAPMDLPKPHPSASNGFASASSQLPPVNLQQPPPPLPSSYTTVQQDPNFGIPHPVDVCTPPPTSSMSRYTSPPPIDSFSGVVMGELQPYIEPNGSSVSSRNQAHFPSPPLAGDTGFEASMSGFEGAGAQFMGMAGGGFEEAALQQEAQEKECRGAGFMAASDAPFPMPSGQQGQFEIGTFSIQDVNGSADNSKGRKITRQPSTEDLDGEEGDDGWETDEQNEDQ